MRTPRRSALRTTSTARVSCLYCIEARLAPLGFGQGSAAIGALCRAHGFQPEPKCHLIASTERSVESSRPVRGGQWLSRAGRVIRAVGVIPTQARRPPFGSGHLGVIRFCKPVQERALRVPRVHDRSFHRTGRSGFESQASSSRSLND